MMKNPRKMAYIATLFGTVGLLAGCASMNPDQIRREMQNLTDAKKFDAARAVQVKSNPGGLIMSEEEKAKEQMILEVVNPAEIQYWRTEDTRKVNEFVSARNFMPPAICSGRRSHRRNRLSSRRLPRIGRCCCTRP